jgi:hypothetical protein
MTLDTKARNLAVKLLNKFGKIITLQSITEGSYDPSTGDMSANTITTYSPFAIIGDYNGIKLTGGTIQQGDRKVTIAALGYALPQPADKVIIDNESYNVIAVKNTWSGNLSALYEMQVRK